MMQQYVNFTQHTGLQLVGAFRCGCFPSPLLLFCFVGKQQGLSGDDSSAQHPVHADESPPLNPPHTNVQ